MCYSGWPETQEEPPVSDYSNSRYYTIGLSFCFIYFVFIFCVFVFGFVFAVFCLRVFLFTTCMSDA